mgnify:FL=1
MYCKYCGKSIDEDSSYCRYFGKHLHESLGITDNISAIKETCAPKTNGIMVNTSKVWTRITQKKKNVIFFFILLLLLLVCGLCGIFGRKRIADISINQVSQELTAATKKYDELYGFHEGLARVCKDKKYGFIDKLGNEIISCKYDDAEDYDKGISVVTLGDKKGAINREGDMVIPCKYDNINLCKDDSLAAAFINETSGFIDLEGNIVVPFDYEYCGTFSEGLADVRKNGLIRFVNKNGKLVIPCKYTNSLDFSEGLVGVSIDGGEDGVVDDKWGYIDKTGKIVIPFQGGLTGSPFSSGLSMRYRGGLTTSYDKNGFPVMHETAFEGAFIYKNGKQASDFFETQNIQGFRNGYCVIKDKNGWEGLVNTQGEFTIPCKYSFIANGFDDKYVLIGINNKYGFADKATGQIVIPPIYEIDYSGWSFNEGLIPVKKDGKYGYINEHNQIVIPFNYDYALAFSEGFAVVKRYGKYGYVDRFGHDTFN